MRRAGPGPVPAPPVPAHDHRRRRRRRDPHLVARDFTADVPGTKLVGDITHLPADLAGLAVPGHGDRLATPRSASATHSPSPCAPDLVIDALQMGARNYTLAGGANSTPIVVRKADSTGRRNASSMAQI